MKITIPYKFKPRPYQLELLRAIDSGYKRAIAIYHRRAGKDKTLFNLVIKKAVEKKGTYYYFFPEFAQGRRVIWEGMDGSGMPFLDHVPEVIIKKKHNTDMKLELVNGSQIQIIGTDKFDKIRGANPVGCVFSEFAFQNPMAWDVVRPILIENGGWAVFNSSVNGKNHFYQMYQKAKEDDSWFVQNLTVEDTRDENGNRYITDEMIEAERAAGMSEQMIRQEFYNDFLANSEAYYFLKDIEKARQEGRIGDFKYDPTYPVYTFWDIGYNDKCAIWFVQIKDNNFYLIDYLEDSQKSLKDYALKLNRKPYVYVEHNFPHDMGVTEFGSGRTRIEQAYQLFKGTRVNVLPKIGFEDGIEAVRVVIDRCYFNKNTTSAGIFALENYKRKFNKQTQEYLDSPIHDFASHGADAFRYFALGVTVPKKRKLSANHKLGKFRRGIIVNDWRLA